MFDIDDVITCRRSKHDKHPGRHVHLTRGKEYRVTNFKVGEVQVRNDIGEYMFYSETRFYPLPEQPHDEIKEAETEPLLPRGYKSRAEQGEFKEPDEDR